MAKENSVSDPAPGIELEELFGIFLAHNAGSSMQVSAGVESRSRIVNPWGDSSLAIEIPETPSEIAILASVLNNLYLPERFSAIYHRDLRALEFIWSAVRLEKSQQEIAGRAFKFKFEGREHECRFENASSGLLLLGAHLELISTSLTNWRNMQSFAIYADMDQEEKARFNPKPPVSFWIHNIDWDENYALLLINNINFYLTYYDDRSPKILIHDPVEEKSSTHRTRYIVDHFPEEIEARPLDSNLLSFWNYADAGNPMIRFILYFRIIEYAAFHYIESNMRSQLRRVLMSPNFMRDSPKAIEDIVASISVQKLEDIARFKAVIRHSVKPELLWRDINANRESFTRETLFDGGFSVKALISKESTETTFGANGVDMFSDSIRKIRNTLSHGKDQETSGVITPTSRNFRLLAPWVHLIATVAGEVVVFRDIT